ncbi:MAG TPA: ABC transporter ATP-binding protein [Caulobacteraceae bacterium]|jgi:peptide/nickel transport system ATP-binding protein|nr:ABC transporter ATP-binding protein [Caulobacteraceae bacterium]
MTPAPALAIEDLDLAYRVRGRDVSVLHRLSLRIGPGESYGLVGESGSGKSTVALAAVRYLPPNGRVLGGRVLVAGRDLYGLAPEALRRLRATEVSMVYQDPGRALNPSIRVGEQVAEIFRLQGLPPARARDRAVEMLARMRIADPASVADRYPHLLSGGMQQRVAIAMALSTDPRLLILDEPTTGLDVTVEAEILELIAQVRAELGTALLLISHNLAVVAGVCDRVGVLYAGSLVEEGPTREVFDTPRHPYTVGLMRCLPQGGRRKDHGRLDVIPGFPPAPGEGAGGCVFAPRCGLATDRCRAEAPPLHDLGGRLSRCHYPDLAASLPRAAADGLPASVVPDRSGPPILEARGLGKTFGRVRALHDVSLALHAGETLGLVGESGSGKTTLARLLLGLVAPDPGGVVALDGRALAMARRPDQRKALQIVFQNPDSALNPAHSVRRLVGRALVRLARVRKPDRAARLLGLTRSVQLADRYLELKPTQLSGGLKQRVAIARAFAGEPRIVVCDEPTSALDVSVQASVLNLLAELQARRGTAYLFISHDLGTVRYLADRIAVLYLGRLMEIGPSERVFSGPHHPYTASLLSAAPVLNGGSGGRVRLEGEIPSAIDLPGGCVFHTRCPRKLGPVCEREEPALHPGAEPGHEIWCHIPVGEL